MAAREIVINPISRVEGHGKVVVHLDDQGQVSEAQFHVLQFRGFEVFCQGRPYEEMPIITQRICGICPVSHQLASAKACDAVLGLGIPPAAALLRELLHMGQYIQSHALHFFYLASPDLLLGWDSDPATRNVVGIIASFPEAATQGLKLRKFGQEIIAALAGKKIHPAYSLPGGVSDPLAEADRQRLLAGFDPAFATALLALDLCKGWLDGHAQEALEFANFDSNYAGLVDPAGRLNLYDGQIRVSDSQGQRLAQFDDADYLKHLGEQAEAWSYLKFPFYKALGYPQGMYRVGPLGRLNVCDDLATPLASAELREYRQRAGQGLIGGSLMYHYARLVELLYALERAQELLQDPHLCDSQVKYTATPAHEQGVGVVEAPRGILIHHYWVDEQGALTRANLIVATGHNNLAMNRAVKEVAQRYISGQEIREGLLNRVEGAIRCYDPCLSCSTHALGRMPLRLEVRAADGELVSELSRD